MEEKLKEVLQTSTLKKVGIAGGGCINTGQGYRTDNGMIFVKINSKQQAKLMFDGEYEGLTAIWKTKTVQVPKPIVVTDNPKGGAVLVMEYLNMSSLSKSSRDLGELLAMLHLYNEKNKKKTDSAVHGKDDDDHAEQTQYISEFGFHTATCCGYIAQDNTWNKDWLQFYSQQRLLPQLQLVETKYGSREVNELWSNLQLKLPSYFEDETITPSLLHGDLWSGNAAENENGPVVFDPAAFYGHSEFDLAITEMFGGFPKSFYNAYHQLIPKKPGYEIRSYLYKLFHYLNHWNHFGDSYRNSTIGTMKYLLKY